MRDSREQKAPAAPGGLHLRPDPAATAAATHWGSTVGFGRNAAFQPTQWSLVARAADGADEGAAEAALAELCQRYWYPLYAWLRCGGRGREDAKDLTQGFFERLLEKGWLAAADREKGKLRTFLLTALKRYAHGQWRKANARKRGGGAPLLDLNYEDGEERYLNTAAEGEPPDKHYERQWVVNLLGRVTEALRQHYVASGKEERYEILKDALQWGGDSAPYAELGGQLGLSEGAVKQAVHRMRGQYRKLLTEEIGSTLETDDPKVIKQELAELVAVFRT